MASRCLLPLYYCCSLRQSDKPYGGVAVGEEEKEKISRGNSQHSVACFPRAAVELYLSKSSRVTPFSQASAKTCSFGFDEIHREWGGEIVPRRAGQGRAVASWAQCCDAYPVKWLAPISTAVVVTPV